MDNDLLIGSFDFEIDLREALHIPNVDIKQLGGSCDVYIRDNEGKNIPHLHLIGPNKFETCICLNEPKYFNHNGVKHRPFANRKQINSFDDFMRKAPSPSLSKRYPEARTNFELCCKAWAATNDPAFVPPADMYNHKYSLDYTRL